MADKTLPQRARVVVIGGGVIGTLGRLPPGPPGLEGRRAARARPAHSGTTWHAAGLMVTFGSTSETSTEMRKYTRDLYARLEAETGLATGLQAGRLHRGRRRRGPARGVPPGLGVQPATAASTCRRSRRARSASCSRSRAPTTCSPASTSPRTAAPTRSTSRCRWPRARGMAGATIVEGVPVTGRAHRARRGDRRTHRARRHRVRVRRQLRRHVGPPARRAGRREHPAAGRRALLPDHRADRRRSRGDWPVLEDPASLRLLPRGGRRPDGRPVRAGLRAVEGRRRPGGLLVRRAAARLGPDGALPREGDGAASRSRSRSASRSSSAARRASRPTCSRSSARRPRCSNYFVAAGLNSIGILTGGGLGRVLAHWIVDGRPDVDVTGINIDRLHTLPGQPRVPRAPAPSSRSAWSTSATTRRGRCRRRAARRRPPFHDRLAARGAYFRDVSGWEGADWYAPAGARRRSSSRCRGAGRTGSPSGRPSTTPRARA